MLMVLLIQAEGIVVIFLFAIVYLCVLSSQTLHAT